MRTFEDVSAVSYAVTKGRIAETLRDPNKMAEVRLAAELTERFRAQYRHAGELARAWSVNGSGLAIGPEFLFAGASTRSPSMETVLIIEDDAALSRGLKDNFAFQGYNVSRPRTANAASSSPRTPSRT